MPHMYALDVSAFQALNGWAGHWPILDQFAVFCASWLIFVMAAAGISRAAYLAIKKDPFGAVALSGIPRALVASGAAFYCNQLFAAFIWFRARPYVDIAAVHRLIADPVTPQSFPSGHASVAFAIAFTSLMVDPKFSKYLLSGAMFVALGRVFVGVHYPLDVLAGAAIGLLWALIARTVLRRMNDVGLIKRLFSL